MDKSIYWSNLYRLYTTKCTNVYEDNTGGKYIPDWCKNTHLRWSVKKVFLENNMITNSSNLHMQYSYKVLPTQIQYKSHLIMMTKTNLQYYVVKERFFGKKNTEMCSDLRNRYPRHLNKTAHTFLSLSPPCDNSKAFHRVIKHLNKFLIVVANLRSRLTACWIETKKYIKINAKYLITFL